MKMRRGGMRRQCRTEYGGEARSGGTFERNQQSGVRHRGITSYGMKVIGSGIGGSF